MKYPSDPPSRSLRLSSFSLPKIENGGVGGAVGGDRREVLAVHRRQHHIGCGAERGELRLPGGDELLPVRTRGVDLHVEAEIVEVAQLLGEEHVELPGAGGVAVAGDVGDGAGILIARAGVGVVRTRGGGIAAGRLRGACSERQRGGENARQGGSDAESGFRRGSSHEGPFSAVRR